jgi:hypothetical protein
MSLFDTIKKAVGKVTSWELGSDIYDMTHQNDVSPPPAPIPTPSPKSIYDITQKSITGKERTFWEIASGAPTIESATLEAPAPMSLSSVVNNAVGQLAVLGNNLPSQGGPENIAKAVWWVLQAPRNVIEWIRSWVDAWFQARDSYVQWESTSKILSKGLKAVVDPALSIISATPVPMMVQAGLQFAWLADEAQGGVNFLKNWVSETLTQKFWVDADVAEELGGTLIDGAQTIMSMWGGSKSSKSGGSQKVQSLRDVARQKEIIDALTTKAAARPGATKSSIKAEVKAAMPQIRQATSRQLTLWELAQHNLKMLGYDVAANTALPVLGIAMQSVKNGDFNDVTEALASFTANAWVTLATAIPWFKGIKSSNKKQMQIGEEASRWKMIEENYQSVIDTQKIEWRKATKQEIEYAQYVKQQKEWEIVPAALPKESPVNAQEYMVNRDQPQVITPEDRRRYIEDNAERFLESGKWPTGRKLTKSEKLVLEKFIAAKNAARIESSKVTAWENPWVVYQETLALPAPEQFVPTPVVIRNYEQEARDRVTQQRLDDENKTLRNESLYGELPPEAFNQPPTLADTMGVPKSDPIVEAGLLTEGEAQSGIPKKSTTTEEPFNFGNNQDTLMKAEKPATWYTLKLSRMLGATGRIFKNVADRLSLGNINRVWADWLVQDFTNYLDQSWKNISTGTMKNMQEFSGIIRDKVAPILSFNKKWNDNDFIGRLSPRGIEITKKNVGEFRKSFDNIDSLSENISIDGFTNKDLNAMNRASYIYTILKDDPAALNKYFTPEQQAILGKIDSEWLPGQRSVGEKMQSDQVYNGVLDDDYRREVMTYENWKRIAPELKEPITVTLANGTVRTFDDIVQAEAFVRMARIRGEKLTPDMENISTLSKTKGGDNLDLYRIHGAIPSWISYMKAVGELYADTHTARELNAVAADKRTNKYMADIRNNGFGPSIEDRILGLSSKSKLDKRVNQFTGAMTAITLWVPTWALSWLQSTTKNLADALTSAGINLVKWRVWSAAKDIWGAIKATPGTLLWVMRSNMGGMSKFGDSKLKAQEIQQALYNEGFVSGWEVGETAAWQDYLATISGARQENAAKTDAALRAMRRSLADNGYKTSDANSIIDQWQAFKKEKPDAYLYARNSIYNDTLILGDMSRQAKFNFMGAWRILGPIKTFQTGLVASLGNDISRVVDGISGMVRSGTTNPEQAMKAAYRIWLRIAGPAYLYQAIYSTLPDDMDEKMKNAVADYLQQRIWTSAWQDTAQFTQGIFDAIPVEKAIQIAQTIYDGWDTRAQWKKWGQDYMKALLGQALDNFRRTVAPLRDANRLYAAVTGETGQAELTKLIGTPNIENATKYGLDTGNRIDTQKEAFMELLGLGIDNTITNLIRNPNKVGSDAVVRQGILDFINPIRAFRNADIMRNWEQSTMGELIKWPVDKVTGGSDAPNARTSPGERQMYKQTVYDVLTVLDKKDIRRGTDDEMVWVMLGQLNIDPRWTKLVRQELNARLDTIAKANDKTEERLEVRYDPRQVTGTTVLDKMEDLHTKNPKGYNDFVSWLAEFSQAEQVRAKGGWQASFTTFTPQGNGALIPDTPADAAYIETVLGKYRDSSWLADQAIADFNNERSLTTSAINQAFQALEIAKADIGKISPTEIKAKLQNINDYLVFLEKSWNYTGNHTDAAALKTFSVGNTLASIADAKVLGEKILAPYPMIASFLHRALSVRGEDVPEFRTPGVTSVTSTPRGATWQKKAGWYTAPKSLTDITWITPLPNKKKSEPLKLSSVKYQKAKIETSPRRLTISELMKARKKQ